MQASDTIRKRREELGLNAVDVAATAGLGFEAYRDIESYENEAFTIVELRALRAVCELLKLDLLSMFAIECQFCPGSDTDLFRLPRNALISRGRTALALTREQLGDRVGFETIAIEEMEQDAAFLERWSVELIQQLATELRIPVHALLRTRCAKCGHGDGSER